MNPFKDVERGLFLSAIVLCTASIPAPAVAADFQTCKGGSFSVDATNIELGLRICGYLTEAAEDLSECGLYQTKPIHVEVVPGISHPIGKCLAYFDCEFDVIKVTDPARFEDFLTTDDPYYSLPRPVLLRSLLIHELAHALTAHAAGQNQVDIVDQEYVAAALEMEFLDPKWRNKLLRAAPVSLPPKTGLIDKWIYGLEPRKFATNAWQHFKAHEDGCELIAQIAAGKFSFRK